MAEWPFRRLVKGRDSTGGIEASGITPPWFSCRARLGAGQQQYRAVRQTG
jgi:hypothetical protein